MKKILLIALTVIMVCVSFSACSLFKKEEPTYAINLNDPTNLVYDIPSCAKAGDTVTIRVKDKTSASSIIEIANVTVEKKTDGVNKWIYTFTMPEHDVIVKVKVIQTDTTSANRINKVPPKQLTWDYSYNA